MSSTKAKAILEDFPRFPKMLTEGRPQDFPARAKAILEGDL